MRVDGEHIHIHGHHKVIADLEVAVARGNIERAVVFGVDEMIDVNQLSPSPVGVDATSGWPFPSESPWTIERLNRAYAEWVLARTSGDKQSAAAILGIDLSTLYRWRRKRSN